MQNNKTTIEQRRKWMKDAEIIASLDNDAECSNEFKKAKQDWIDGKISDEDLLRIAIKS